MAKKLWGGRFKKKTDPLVEEFTKSIDYDKKLAIWDIIGSMAHVCILAESKIITNSDADELAKALREIFDDIAEYKFPIDNKCEDIHTNIQNIIEQKIGNEIALKLHTARSRNDQVLFDLKCFCNAELITVKNLCSKLVNILNNSCDKTKGIIIPGYTHLQHAQLIYLSDYLATYVEMLKRDMERIDVTKNNIKIFLGAGALAGTPIDFSHYNNAAKSFFGPIKNKEGVKELNLKFDGAVSNSLDAVSNRDFVVEILSTLSILGMHLSRFAEDIIIWSTKEFGFVEMDDAFTTGSSLVPQKKNPDVLELIRGYTGTLYGNLVSVLTMMKGLPLTYNRDMQLDKPPIFSSFEIIEKELKVLPGLIETLEWKEDVIKKKIEQDETLYATDWVYYLVKEKNVPFKEAHDIIGMLVKESIDTGVKIKDMKDKHVKNKISDKIDIKELVKLMDPEKSVNSRISVDRSKLKT